jgi:hypothetical protein
VEFFEGISLLDQAAQVSGAAVQHRERVKRREAAQEVEVRLLVVGGDHQPLARQAAEQLCD